MSKKQSTAVVPAPKQVPAIRRNTDVVPDFSLYDGEKHFTDRLDRDGPDIACSMTPSMCNQISRNIKNAIFVFMKFLKGYLRWRENLR